MIVRAMVLAFVGIVFLPNNVLAAQCLNRDKLLWALEKKHMERVVATGVSNQGKIFTEIFASDSGSWTVVMTTTNKISCIVAAGHEWYVRSPAIPKPGV